ncbi:hypothetical protein ABIA33_005985 [Streptacidiphilus sp. MAP12-16]|jgi:hypothetical protein|uniref:hypothetical protein n=1 Tax=Streptacidiphilus sp. MAP12-16 TaxID=3156300 RepID=UPI00351814D4
MTSSPDDTPALDTTAETTETVVVATADGTVSVETAVTTPDATAQADGGPVITPDRVRTQP